MVKPRAPIREEILGAVRAILCEMFNIDEDEVAPSTRLVRDLGAESIHFLDIIFRLERDLQIKIPRGELFPEPIVQGNPEYVQDGKVTKRGLQEMRAKMPFADLTAFERNPDVSALNDLFTVELLCRYLERKCPELY